MESSFTLLREIGTLKLSESEEIRFSIDAYHGYRYVSVRRYLKIEELFSPTRDGITLSPEMVRLLVPMLLALPDDPAKVPEGEIGKFAKRAGICVVVRVSDFKGYLGLDLRQWQSDAGFTKKGIWLPLEKIKKIKQLFSDTLDALNEKASDFS
jgi:hypothetical protein